jgi:hypothetical protein
MVEVCATKGPGLLSRRLIVGRETEEALAKFRCSQRSSALAALIISLVIDSESKNGDPRAHQQA